MVTFGGVARFQLSVMGWGPSIPQFWSSPHPTHAAFFTIERPNSARYHIWAEACF